MILFSINKIISLELITDPELTPRVLTQIENSPEIKTLNTAIYGHQRVNRNTINSMQQRLNSTVDFIGQAQTDDKEQSQERNELVRLQLLDVKYNYTTQLALQTLTTQKKSLLFSIWFWFWSSITWFATIICNKLANRIADFLIEKLLTHKST